MRRVAVALSWGLLAGCGTSAYEPRGSGSGLLISSAAVKGISGQRAAVPFDVQLPCGPGGPMRDITAAAGQVIDPADAVAHVNPPWQTADRVTYDCTQDERQRLTHLEVAFTPQGPGSYRVEVTLEPGVGTFTRTLEAQ